MITVVHGPGRVLMNVHFMFVLFSVWTPYPCVTAYPSTEDPTYHSEYRECLELHQDVQMTDQPNGNVKESLLDRLSELKNRCGPSYPCGVRSYKCSISFSTYFFYVHPDSPVIMIDISVRIVPVAFPRQYRHRDAMRRG